LHREPSDIYLMPPSNGALQLHTVEAVNIGTADAPWPYELELENLATAQDITVFVRHGLSFPMLSAVNTLTIVGHPELLVPSLRAVGSVASMFTSLHASFAVQYLHCLFLLVGTVVRRSCVSFRTARKSLAANGRAAHLAMLSSPPRMCGSEASFT